MNLKRACSVLFVSSVLVASPGLPAWEAAAQVVVRAPAPVGAVGAWAAAVGGLATAVQTQPELAAGSLNLTSVLGRLRLELALNPGSQAALAFVARLPSAAAEPKTFAALAPAEQARLIDAAIAATAAELQPRAESLASRALSGGSVSETQRAELDAVAARWFYLSPETASEVKKAAAAFRAAEATGLAGRMARALGKKESADDVAKAEIAQIFAGTEKLVERETGAASPQLVEDRLAPYAARALDEAEARAQERGVPAGKVSQAFLENHTFLFGRVASRKLFKDLRARGQWTEFAAAASLHAADLLAATGAAGRNALAKAAEGDDLRLAIPAWHPLFGRYASIAEWLTDAHGKPDVSKDLKGTRLFTVFGIPVMAAFSLWPALILGAMQFSSMFVKSTPAFGAVGHFMQALATIVLVYFMVLLHEIGHALAARIFGIRTRQMILNWLGGGAQVLRGFRQALPEFVIALAGPAVSALLGVGSVALARALQDPTFSPILMVAGRLNLVLALYNLFPLYPMDGARVLRAMLTRVVGGYRATKAAALVSLALSALLTCNGLALYLTNGDQGLFRLFIGAVFMAMSAAMSIHPGTTTVDEKTAKKS